MWANLLRSVESRYSYGDGSQAASDATTSRASNESLNTGLFAERRVCVRVSIHGPVSGL